MKKLFNLLSVLSIIALVAVSCSKDEGLIEPVSDVANVTFSVDVPSGVQTRAGEGVTVDKLYYEVYNEAGEKLATRCGNVMKNTASAPSEFSISLDLVKQQTYTILFWAEKSGNGVYDASDLKNVTVNYDNVTSNNENLDAFFAAKTFSVTTENLSQTIYLKRPFAQVNLGTTKESSASAAELDIYVSKTMITVGELPTAFNVADGKTSGKAEDVVFALAPIKPSVSGVETSVLATDVNKDGTVDPATEHFDYLSFNYLLLGNETTNTLVEVKAQLELSDGNVINHTISSLPIQRNYRTNIVGNLLTSQTNFTVVVEPDFLLPDIIMQVWDGKTVKAVTPVAENGVNVYYIYDAAQLAWIADQVNNNGKTFKDEIVKLAANIDLNSMPWTPIGLTGDAAGFQGTFDGTIPTKVKSGSDSYFTISNLYIDLTKTPKYQSAGLFGSARHGEIKNFNIVNAVVKNLTTGDPTSCGTAVVVGSAQFPLTITNVNVSNAKVEGNRYVGGIAGYFAGKVSGCSVTGSSIFATPDNLSGNYDNGDKVGGIIGYVNSSNNYTTSIEKNNVINTTVEAYRDLGGIVGYVRDVVKDNSLNKVTVIQNSLNGYKTSPITTVGEVYGAGTPTEQSNNTSSEVKIFKGEEIIIVNVGESIQSAIDNVADDAETIIYLAEGTHNPMKLEISGKKAIRLMPYNGAAVTIDGTIKVSGKVYLEGMTLTNMNVVNVGPSALDNSCVALTSEGYAEIVNCTFNMDPSKTSATAVKDWWGTGKMTNAVVKNCTFNCNGNRPFQLHDNGTIEGCTINNPYRYVVQVNSEYNGLITMKNNIVNKTQDNGKPVYFIQLTCGGSEAVAMTKNMTFDVANNRINRTATNSGSEQDALYAFEKGTADLSTITLTEGEQWWCIEDQSYAGYIYYPATNTYEVFTVKGLQDAINATPANATEASTINVKKGTYKGSFNITGSRKVNIISTEGAVINGLIHGDSGNYITLKGLTLTNEFQGTSSTSRHNADGYCLGGYANYWNIEDCTFNVKSTDKGAINIYAAFNACTEEYELVVKNSTFNCNGERPIRCKSNTKIDGCTFNDQNRYAMQFQANNQATSEKVVFTNNIINNPCVSSGEAFAAGVQISQSQLCEDVDITISGNTINSALFTDLKFAYDHDESKPSTIGNIKITTCKLNGNLITESQCKEINAETNEVIF